MCAWGERGGGSTKKSVKQSVRKKPYLPDHMSVGEVLELIIQAMFTLIFQTKMHLLRWDFSTLPNQNKSFSLG